MRRQIFCITYACIVGGAESRTQFIAALGDAQLTTGNNAESWGFWHVDPGPRGVHIGQYTSTFAGTDIAPAGWKFNMSDWWVEEYGRIMEKPAIPIQAGTYTVSNFRGNPRRVMLVISPMGEDGHQAWELQGANLQDVTHGPCRTGRYRPASPSAECSPVNMPVSNFPVHSGGKMPTLDGCDTLDYRVLFVHAVEPAFMQTMAPSAVGVTKTMVASRAVDNEMSTTAAGMVVSSQSTTLTLLEGDISPNQLSCSYQRLGRLLSMAMILCLSSCSFGT